MQINLSLSEFLDLASTSTVVPLSVEVLGDRETPVSVFEKLVGPSNGFLLESVEGGEQWARWSFVGWAPEVSLVEDKGETRVTTRSEIELPELRKGDPLGGLDLLVNHFSVPSDDALFGKGVVPPLTSGVVGYLGYDVVRSLEDLPNKPIDDRNLPDMAWQFFGMLAVVDRFRQTIRLIRNVYISAAPAAQYEAALAELSQAIKNLGKIGSYTVKSRCDFSVVPESRPNMTQEEFEAAVARAVEYIRAGDALQIVPSLRWETDFSGDPFEVYRALRVVNPSPFMFYLRHDDIAISGASPELMARSRDGRAEIHPIAGTKPRGSSIAEDIAFENELLADPKERAEHVMLVDLARNDLGRVCEYGSVEVETLMTVERYSHVMHIASVVAGRLEEGVGPIDLLRATFPNGTVSGAPKVRAMEIIDELEPTARGPYAGAVGYIDFSGNVDTAIALRTLVAANGKAWVQAGAGVVADSDPATEYQECLNKAAAALAALAAASHG